MQCPRIVIAGERSNAGKSTIVAGILLALKRRGLDVRPFKAGPDFLDPMHHSAIIETPCRNLDTWMFPGAVKELFCRSAAGADISVIEGVMGLYDGVDGISEDGSTAHLAKVLDAPVLLVLDARGSARSMGAVAMGFVQYDPSVRICGIIFNNVGSTKHLDMLMASLRDIPCIGGIPRDESIQLPSRHLGLIPAGEQDNEQAYNAMADLVERHLDIDLLIRLAGDAPDFTPPRETLYGTSSPKVRLGVARDEAFNFYYQDNLDILSSYGAEIVTFSPLRDRLPEVDGIYLGGGYPELHAHELSHNTPMLKAVRRASDDGMPIYAECGGMMYACSDVVSPEGDHAHMTGIFDATVEMTTSLQALSYVETTTVRDTILAPRGTTIRGHEFHFSRVRPQGDVPYAYRHERGKGIKEGYDGLCAGNTLASYLHLHFGTNPSLAQRFVSACEAYSRT